MRTKPQVAVNTLLAALSISGLISPAGAQAPVVRDSAGVRIIENPSRARAPVAFKLGTTPVVHLGGPDEAVPDNEFVPNQGYLRAARLADGGFAVIDVTRVHFFDARGRRLKIAGRAGSGPEEFRYLTTVCRTRGDTIVVYDSHNSRFAVLDRNGGIVRTVKQTDRSSPPFDGCFDDGTVLLQNSMGGTPGTTRTAHMNRVRMDGTAVNKVGEFVLPPFDMVTQSEASVIASQQRLYLGDGTASEIRVYAAPTGKLSMIIRTADPPVRITAEETEDRMRGTIPNNVSGAEVAQRMERMRSMPHATTWPAYRRVHVDSRGVMWMQDYQTKYPAPIGWTAFGADGTMLGRLIIPAPATPQQRIEVINFFADGILVRRRDEDGFNYLTLYPIQPVLR